MVLELHVWGPAFGLPSLDAQCLAAIAYLNQALPSGEWVLVASSDPTISPLNELPALRNGSTWISKYRNIVDYLRQYSAGQWDLDEDLDPRGKGESIAFSSFVESQGQPLLDLSLYVSSENYTNVTRASYGELLHWPSQWFTPHGIRAVARKRSDHLGLSSLDVDTEASQDGASGSENIPKSLMSRQKETVSSLLGRPTHKNQFRLDALTSAFYEPLESLMGTKEYLLSRSSASSLDCLATGYLSLMVYPKLPHEWTKASMQTKYPKLAEYTKKTAEAFYGPPVHVSEAFKEVDDSISGGKGSQISKLPWQIPPKASFSTMGTMILSSIADNMPVVNQLRADRQLKEAATDPTLDSYDKRQLETIAQGRTREIYSQIATVGGVLGLFMTYLFYEGIVEWPGRSRQEDDKDSNRNFGEAGSMLGL